jgi:hypothetical protein
LSVVVGSSSGMTGMAAMSLVGVDPAMVMQTIGNSFLGVPAKTLLAFPLVYHYLASLRHWVRPTSLSDFLNFDFFQSDMALPCRSRQDPSWPFPRLPLPRLPAPLGET